MNLVRAETDSAWGQGHFKYPVFVPWRCTLLLQSCSLPAPPTPSQIQLRDKDVFKSDDDLGYAVLPLAGLRGGEEVDLNLRVEGDEEGRAPA